MLLLARRPARTRDLMDMIFPDRTAGRSRASGRCSSKSPPWREAQGLMRATTKPGDRNRNYLRIERGNGSSPDRSAEELVRRRRLPEAHPEGIDEENLSQRRSTVNEFRKTPVCENTSRADRAAPRTRSRITSGRSSYASASQAYHSSARPEGCATFRCERRMWGANRPGITRRTIAFAPSPSSRTASGTVSDQ